jgi:hypothetical protein
MRFFGVGPAVIGRRTVLAAAGNLSSWYWRMGAKTEVETNTVLLKNAGYRPE